MKKISKNFYRQKDVVELAQAFLGTYLVTEIRPGEKTIGKIVETEAYQGPFDKASHAYDNRRTARTETMYLAGGVAYIYLCYGIHHLFNIVTGPKETPHAVLVRALEPVSGIEWMLKRRHLQTPKYNLTAGPGAMSQAMGITTQLNKMSLTSNIIWIEERSDVIQKEHIIASPRVGVSYAQEHALLPWRFYLKGNKWVSRYGRK